MADALLEKLLREQGKQGKRKSDSRQTESNADGALEKLLREEQLRRKSESRQPESQGSFASSCSSSQVDSALGKPSPQSGSASVNSRPGEHSTQKPPVPENNVASNNPSPQDVPASANSAEPVDELDRQAQELAEKALEKVPLQMKLAKLPKVKEGILKRLRTQAQAAASTVQQDSPAGGPASGNSVDNAAQNTPVAPPPPPPLEKRRSAADYDRVETCGDESWFDDPLVRRALRESVAAAHAEQKILVGVPAAEIKRISPSNDRPLGAGAVLRLGGAALGGYGESDIDYAFRQLSRALHPDKNHDIPEAAEAFKRLSEAAEELRQGLNDAREILKRFSLAMGRTATPEILERPQEAILAEVTRLFSVVLGIAGEGEVPVAAKQRALQAFESMSVFAKCPGEALVAEWYNNHHLLDMIAEPAIRQAYDCSPKRFRAQFFCLLNRVALAESKRQDGAVRGKWQQIMEQFPEICYWRELLESLKKRVWTLDGKDGDADAEAADLALFFRPKIANSASENKKSTPAVQEAKEGTKDDPVCWNFVTNNFCKAGDRCRYMHKFPPGYNAQKAAVARKRPPVIADASTEKKGAEASTERKEKEPSAEGEKSYVKVKTSKWARWWRDAIQAVVPLNTASAMSATHPEVRKLSVALWRDIAKWTIENGMQQALELFKAEPSGRSDPTGGIHPCGSDAEWGFVPATDILMVVADGLLGITCEGFMVNGPAGFQQETFEDAKKRLNFHMSKELEGGDGDKPAKASVTRTSKPSLAVSTDAKAPLRRAGLGFEQPQVAARPAKRIKAMVLTADGEWQEEDD